MERDSRGFNRRIDLHSFGQSAHGASPALGVNAIHSALDFLDQAFKKGIELRFIRTEGGDTTNKVPDHAIMQFYLNSAQFEDFKRFFREVLKTQGVQKKFRVELGGIGDAGVRFLPSQLFPCMMEIVGFFNRIAEELAQVKDSTYDPISSTVNFGQLKQRPGNADMLFDLRILPEISATDLQDKIKKGIQEIASRYPNLNIVAVRDRYNPPLDMSLEDQFLRICRESMNDAGIEPTFSKESVSTEAAQYFQMGYPSVVFGPGKSHGNSHSPNEYNSIEHLEKAILFYEKVIEKVCL